MFSQREFKTLPNDAYNDRKMRKVFVPKNATRHAQSRVIGRDGLAVRRKCGSRQRRRCFMGVGQNF